MVKNSNLHAAKTAKNDEFYTQLTDIEKELKHYKEHFAGKTVLCNCNDLKETNFAKFFSYKFEDYGLKKLICTSYDDGDGKGSIAVYEGDKNGNNIPDPEEWESFKLQTLGDFRCEECIELLKEADIVVTNPPFSLFREYVAQLVAYDKKFLIIGNMNAITYKEIFPLIKENKMWLGQNAKGGSRKGNSMTYVTPSGDKKDISTWWFTNMDCQRRNTPIDQYKKYSAEEYPKYDNYDAIECGKSCEIPMDYDGVIGVPISFLMFHCPKQFEIVKFRKGNDGKDLSVNGKCPYFRILIKRINNRL